MSGLLQQSIDHAATAAPSWLQSRLLNSRKVWAGTELPTRKTEAWKYTGLHQLQQTFVVAAEPASLQAPAGNYPDLGGCQLVFVDGYYRADLSSPSLPDGCTLVRFADADETQAALISQHLGTALADGKHVFATLNDAALTDGVLVKIDPDCALTQSLQLVWLSQEHSEATSVSQRLLVLMGQNSRAELVEHFAGSPASSAVFTNGITELLLEPGAQLDHYRLQLESGLAIHIGGVHAKLAANSTLRSFHLALGSALKRVDIVINHCGQGAHSELNGIYLPHRSEHIDYHTCIEHRVPHCTSSENFRGIIADEASAVFNGRIHIHPGAQKTRAELSNKNLLTSARAEINTKPELEIYADDVQCAHGATVAQLDPATLHYLRTRGISRAEAEVMLSFGFINELVDAIALHPLRDFLKPLLAQWFSRDPQLTRHIV